MQKILTLLMAILIVYLAINHSSSLLDKKVPKNDNHINNPIPAQPQKNSGAPQVSQENIVVEGNFIERTLTNIVNNILKTEEGRIFLENLLKPNNHPISDQSNIYISNVDFLTSLFKISEFGEGQKGPASCGHVATISYKILTTTNALIKEGRETFPLGSSKVAPGIDIITVGMKTGQTRHATIPTRYFTSDPKQKNAYFNLQVTLEDITPNNIVADDIKIFDDQITYKLPMVCGMKASYDVRITDLSKNKVIFDSTAQNKKIEMKIGDIKYPMIFSHALHNKIAVGTRTVLAKGKYLKSYLSQYSAIFPDKKLPEQQIYMIEFFNFKSSMQDNVAKFE